jgi:putative transposase
MQVVKESVAAGGTITRSAMCEAVGLDRSTFYRLLRPRLFGPRIRPKNVRALSATEKQAVLDVLHEERFAEVSAGEAHAMLLDEGRYLCSERTMYRILSRNQEVRERRRHRRHTQYVAPELLATGPRMLWSWDISKLRGPTKWTYYHLYVIIDVYSRYVVGWMVAERESSTLAQRLIEETCLRQRVEHGQLTIHADRGASMRSKPVALLLADLGVTKTHSRPYTSNDNPFSEAAFKTLKYRPDFPDRFGSLEDARGFCSDFFAWYNFEHRHSGVQMLTPHDVHSGRADRTLARRAEVMRAVHAAHPERFVRGLPRAKTLEREVWINKPKPRREADLPVPGAPPAAHPPIATPTGAHCAQAGSSAAKPAERTLDAAEHCAPDLHAATTEGAFFAK